MGSRLEAMPSLESRRTKAVPSCWRALARLINRMAPAVLMICRVTLMRGVAFSSRAAPGRGAQLFYARGLSEAVSPAPARSCFCRAPLTGGATQQHAAEAFATARMEPSASPLIMNYGDLSRPPLSWRPLCEPIRLFTFHRQGVNKASHGRLFRPRCLAPSSRAAL
jgi:hypothetical protein